MWDWFENIICYKFNIIKMSKKNDMKSNEYRKIIYDKKEEVKKMYDEEGLRAYAISTWLGLNYRDGRLANAIEYVLNGGNPYEDEKNGKIINKKRSKISDNIKFE